MCVVSVVCDVGVVWLKYDVCVVLCVMCFVCVVRFACFIIVTAVVCVV